MSATEKNLTGRRVLITGCSSGIGRALAEELHKRGHAVIATARQVATLADLPAAKRIAMDVCSEESVRAAVDEAGAIDVVVNNAGIGLWAPAETVPISKAQDLFETNVWGPMRVMQAALPQMRARGSGLVLQVSSAVGSITGPLVGHYAASKHALEALSEVMRLELAPFGVRMVIAALGAVESAFAANRVTVSSDPDYASIAATFVSRLQAMRTEPATAAQVATALADIIEDPKPALRHMVTADAAMLIESRRALSDAQWERNTLQGLVPPDWI